MNLKWDQTSDGKEIATETTDKEWPSADRLQSRIDANTTKESQSWNSNNNDFGDRQTWEKYQKSDGL
jgi:hypothetical protein